MAFSIKNEEADRLARQLASITGESLTEAVIQSLSERLKRHQPRARHNNPGTQLAKMAKILSKLPVHDTRSADEVLGYDEHGLPS